jgi:hypothetical protein
MVSQINSDRAKIDTTYLTYYCVLTDRLHLRHLHRERHLCLHAGKISQCRGSGRATRARLKSQTSTVSICVRRGITSIKRIRYPEVAEEKPGVVYVMFVDKLLGKTWAG